MAGHLVLIVKRERSAWKIVKILKYVFLYDAVNVTLEKTVFRRIGFNNK